MAAARRGRGGRWVRAAAAAVLVVLLVVAVLRAGPVAELLGGGGGGDAAAARLKRALGRAAGQCGHVAAPLLDTPAPAASDAAAAAAERFLCGSQTLADVLRRHVAVGVLVRESDVEKAWLVRRSWGRHLPQLLFVGAQLDGLPSVHTDESVGSNLLPKSLALFRELRKRFPDARVYLKADTDTYLFARNLAAYLVTRNFFRANDPVQFGARYVLGEADCHPYVSGGAGYGFTAAALDVLLARECAAWRNYEDSDINHCVMDAVTLVHAPGFNGDRPHQVFTASVNGDFDFPNHSPPAYVAGAPISFHGFKDTQAFLDFHFAVDGGFPVFAGDTPVASSRLDDLVARQPLSAFLDPCDAPQCRLRVEQTSLLNQ